jgi:hypothetical protein
LKKGDEPAKIPGKPSVASLRLKCPVSPGTDVRNQPEWLSGITGIGIGFKYAFTWGKTKEEIGLSSTGFGQKTADLFSDFKLLPPNRADYKIGITPKTQTSKISFFDSRGRSPHPWVALYLLSLEEVSAKNCTFY